MTDNFHTPPSGGGECPEWLAKAGAVVLVGGTVAAAIGGVMELYHTLKLREQKRINTELEKGTRR